MCYGWLILSFIEVNTANRLKCLNFFDSDSRFQLRLSTQLRSSIFSTPPSVSSSKVSMFSTFFHSRFQLWVPALNCSKLKPSAHRHQSKFIRNMNSDYERHDLHVLIIETHVIKEKNILSYIMSTKVHVWITIT